METDAHCLIPNNVYLAADDRLAEYDLGLVPVVDREKEHLCAQDCCHVS